MQKLFLLNPILGAIHIGRPQRKGGDCSAFAWILRCQMRTGSQSHVDVIYGWSLTFQQLTIIYILDSSSIEEQQHDSSGNEDDDDEDDCASCSDSGELGVGGGSEGDGGGGAISAAREDDFSYILHIHIG